jgi:hypothetical protein
MKSLAKGSNVLHNAKNTERLSLQVQSLCEIIGSNNKANFINNCNTFANLPVIGENSTTQALLKGTYSRWSVKKGEMFAVMKSTLSIKLICLALRINFVNLCRWLSRFIQKKFKISYQASKEIKIFGRVQALKILLMTYFHNFIIFSKDYLSLYPFKVLFIVIILLQLLLICKIFKLNLGTNYKIYNHYLNWFWVILYIGLYRYFIINTLSYMGTKF